MTLQTVEPALRKGKAEDNAEHNSAGNLDGLHAVGGVLLHVIHNKIVGGIINAGTRNKRKDAGNQVYGDRIFADGGNCAGKYGQRQCGDEICNRDAAVKSKKEYIDHPADRTGESAEKKLGFWSSEQHGKGQCGKETDKNLYNHAKKLPPNKKRNMVITVPTPTAIQNAVRIASIMWMAPER